MSARVQKARSPVPGQGARCSGPGDFVAPRAALQDPDQRARPRGSRRFRVHFRSGRSMVTRGRDPRRAVDLEGDFRERSRGPPGMGAAPHESVGGVSRIRASLSLLSPSIASVYRPPSRGGGAAAQPEGRRVNGGQPACRQEGRPIGRMVSTMIRCAGWPAVWATTGQRLGIHGLDRAHSRVPGHRAGRQPSAAVVFFFYLSGGEAAPRERLLQARIVR